MYFYSSDDIVSTESENSVVLNVRVRNNTHYVNLTVTYQDGSEDVLYLSSLKVMSTFSFYDFDVIKIFSKDIEFCLNYRLSNYTIPEIPELDDTEFPFKMSDDHLTRQIYKQEFSKTDTENTLCEQFNLYKVEFEKQFDDCDTKQPNKTTHIIRAAECPRFWANSKDCQQFTFRVLVAEKMFPKDIILDEHMKNVLSPTKRYLNEQDLRDFWGSLIEKHAFDEYQREFSPSASNVMLIVAGLMLIIMLVFIIVVAIFKSLALNEKFSNDTIETTETEEIKEEIDVTIEITSPEQVIPCVYDAHSNSVMERRKTRRNGFDEIGTHNMDNEHVTNSLYAVQLKPGSYTKERKKSIEVTTPENVPPSFYGVHSNPAFVRQESLQSGYGELGAHSKERKKSIEVTAPESVIPSFYGAHSNPAFVRQESVESGFGELGLRIKERRKSIDSNPGLSRRESVQSWFGELGAHIKLRRQSIEVTTPEHVIPSFFGAHSNPAFVRSDSVQSGFGELGTHIKERRKSTEVLIRRASMHSEPGTHKDERELTTSDQGTQLRPVFSRQESRQSNFGEQGSGVILFCLITFFYYRCDNRRISVY